VVRLSVTRGSLDALRGLDTMLVSQDEAAKKHYRVGDKVTWRMPTGKQTYRIVGVYADNGVVFFPFLTTLAAYTEAGFAPQDNVAYLKLEPGADPAKVKAELERATAKLPIITVKDQTEYAAEQRAPIDRLVLMIYALLGLALVIAVLGVVNTLGLSVIERTREIGLLRAIGVDRRQMRRMIGLESVAIAVLGALMGIGMGLVFGISLMASLRDQGLEVTRIPWQSLGVYLLVAVFIGLLAARLPARRAARLDVLRAIGTE
jgi:putative ABC transport system permease protein